MVALSGFAWKPKYCLVSYCFNDYCRAMSTSMQSELKQRKPFEHPEEELYLSFVRTTDLLGRSAATLLKSHELSSAQYNVLRILRGAEPHGLPCGEIGSRMVTRDPDITRLLDRMEAREWVQRERATADRRVITARITPTGLDLLKQLDEPMVEQHRLQLGFLDRKQIENLLQAFEAIRQHLKTSKLAE
jgi:MarR family transcriptional regulator, organic hydroperoxide resistance regulator